MLRRIIAPVGLSLFAMTPMHSAAHEVGVDSVSQQINQLANKINEVGKSLPESTGSLAGTTAASNIDTDSALRILLQGGDFKDVLAKQFSEFSVNLTSSSRGTWVFAGGINQDPSLYEPLAKELDAAQLSSVKEALSSSIDTLDSYTVGIKLVPEDKEDIRLEAEKTIAAFSLGQYAVSMLSESRDDEKKTNFTSLSNRIFDNSISKRKAAAAISNRSKMVFELKHDENKSYTGPSKTALTVSYQRGISGNSTQLRRLVDKNSECFTRLSASGGDQTFLDRCASAFVSAPSILEDAEKEERLAVSLTYMDIEEFSFVDPTSMFSKTYESNRSIAFSATYGRSYQTDLMTAKGAKLDVSLTFDDVKNDEELNDRALLQATYTLDFGDFELPISLTWSNKSELVGDADTKIGGHIGIQYRK